ncbi:MAG TPA: potassium transporter TrkA [Clostridia bacterium]|nr:potassium transporter TrkA [Clostridia bacterium]
MKDKLKYRFDNLMSKGTGVLIASLAIITLLMITIVSFVVWASGANQGTGFLSLFWMGVLRSLDPGTMGGDTGSFLFVGAMFVITLGGIFIFSILVGLLTTGISSKLESLQKGHSNVVEKNHTVILGWSSQIFTVLTELIEANSNQKNACIVIMSPTDKVEMDEAIRSRIPDTKTTRIVTRNGSAIDLNDLGMLSLHTARSIIINQNDDADVIKTLLAVINSPTKRTTPYNIVAVLREPKNVDVAKIAARGQAEIILEDAIISRIIAQTCRQSGLSAVYTELLDFGGDEIYLRAFPELTGKTYGETLAMFETSSVIGLKSKSGVQLNPPMSTALQSGDEIIAVTADDDTLLLNGKAPSFDERLFSGKSAAAAKPESILILGWNENAERIIEELDHYVADDSRITVVSDLPDAKPGVRFVERSLEHAKVTLVEEDITCRAALDEMLKEDFPHIILLSDRTQEDVQKADADTLITLLHLRNIAETTGKQFSIVSEMLDIRNRRLAQVAKVNDFIVSDTIISLLISQVSENNVLNSVFEDVFDADGSEIYLKPAEQYVHLQESVSFYAVVESARRKGETAFGYKIAAESESETVPGGVHINPSKSSLIRFAQGDAIIVAAED